MTPQERLIKAQKNGLRDRRINPLMASDAGDLDEQQEGLLMKTHKTQRFPAAPDGRVMAKITSRVDVGGEGYI